MPTRSLASFQPRSPSDSRARKVLPWMGKFLLVMAFLAMGVVLWLAPRAWGVATRRDLMEAFNEAVTTEPVQLSAALEALPVAPPGFPSEQGTVESVLEAHPLLIAAISKAKHQVFVRAGMRLLPEDGTERSARFLGWAKAAEAHQNEGRYDAPAPPEEPPLFLLMDPAWTWLVQWRPGTEEAEAFLRKALGPHAKVRAGLARNGEPISPKKWPPVAPAFLPPNFQVSPHGPEAEWTVVWTGTILGPHWVTILQPWPEQAQIWDAKVSNRTWSARLVGFGILGLLVLGLTLRRRSDRVLALEADRLAALTHSLKTPLAIHKLRCESLRLGRWAAPQAAEELLRLGQEVDELTRLIERGLIAHHAGEGPQALGTFGAEWLEDVAESLRPTLEADGRNLHLHLVPACGMAHLPSMQSALQTLLENAYYHGSGQVSLVTKAVKHRLRIEVSDEGKGLDKTTLEVLGKPFQRIRQDGEEGFRHEGQGLGLSLLRQVALQEGWGLELWSELGKGFSATLEVPLSPSNPTWARP